MDTKVQRELVCQSLQNNPEAIACFELLVEISQIADDAYDGDKAVDRDDLIRAFYNAMIYLPRNQFYTNFYDEMNIIIRDAWAVWMESNDIERSNNEKLLQVSYITRSAMTDVLIKMSQLVGGMNWRRQVAANVRSLVYLDNENLDEYLDEHLEKSAEESEGVSKRT